MPFKPGDPKPEKAGRKAGATNKRTRDLIEILNEKGYCPVAELIRLNAEAWTQYEEKKLERMSPGSEQPSQYLKIAQACASDLMPYMYPKRKSVEVSGADGKDLFQNIGDLVKSVLNDGKS